MGWGLNGMTTSELVGLTVRDEAPVGWAHVPLRRGLNVLYGKNGAGKTRTLVAIARLLNRVPVESVGPTRMPTPAEALYVLGGVHLSVGRLASDDPLGVAIADCRLPEGPAWLARKLGHGHTVNKSTGERVDDGPLSTTGDLERSIVEHLRATAPWADADPDLARTLIERGQWFVSRAGGTDFIYLAAEPTGPVQDLLRTEADRWRTSATGLTDLVYGYHEDLFSEEASYALDQELRLNPAPPGAFVAPLPASLGLGDQLPVSLPVALVATVTYAPQRDAPTPLVSVSSEGSVDALGPLLAAQLDRRTTPVESLLGRARPATSADGSPSDALREIADALAARAQGLFEALAEDAPNLEIVLGDEKGWLRGRGPCWRVRQGDVTYELDGLGSAHQRLARLAIARSSNRLGRSTYGQTITILDEPERALHPSAVDRIRSAVTELDAVVVVASHSPAFLDDPGAQLLHIRPTMAGQLLISAPTLSADDDIGLDHAAQDLGIRRSDLLALSRVFLLVEGPHDRAVLGHLCRDALAASRARIIHLGGTKDLHHVATSELLFEATTASFVVVVDNEDDGWAQKAYDRALAGSEPWKSGGEVSSERRALLRLLEVASRSYRLDRIVLAPLSKRDIANYLPAAEVVPGFDTWENVDAAFLASTNRRRFKRGDGEPKKRWANGIARAAGLEGRYHTTGLGEIARAIADGELAGEIHSDIHQLREAIRTAAGPGPRTTPTDREGL